MWQVVWACNIESRGPILDIGRIKKVLSSRLRGGNMVQVAWFIADWEVITWFEYHDLWRLVHLVLPAIPLGLISLRSDVIVLGGRGPCRASFNGSYLEREIELVSERFYWWDASWSRKTQGWVEMMLIGGSRSELSNRPIDETSPFVTRVASSPFLGEVKEITIFRF